MIPAALSSMPNKSSVLSLVAAFGDTLSIESPQLLQLQGPSSSNYLQSPAKQSFFGGGGGFNLVDTLKSTMAIAAANNNKKAKAVAESEMNNANPHRAIEFKVFEQDQKNTGRGVYSDDAETAE